MKTESISRASGRVARAARGVVFCAVFFLGPMLGTGSLNASGGGHGGGGHGGGGHGGGGHSGGGGHMSGGGHFGGGGHMSGGAGHFGGSHFSGGHSGGGHSESFSHFGGGGHSDFSHSGSLGWSHSTASGFTAHGALDNHAFDHHAFDHREFDHHVFDHHSVIGHHYGFGFFPAYRSYYPARSYRAVPDYCNPRSPDCDPDYCYYLRYGVFPSAASPGRSSSAPGQNGRAVVLTVDQRGTVARPAAAAPGRGGATEKADRDGVREGMDVELPLISAMEAPEALPMERHNHP